MLHYSFICAQIISRQVPDECCVKNYEPSTRCFGGFIMYQSSLSSYILIGFFDPWPVAAEFERIALLSCDHFRSFWSRFKIWPVRFGGSILKNKMTNWHLSVCLYVLIYLGLSEMIERADSSILWMWMNGSLGLVNWCVCIWIQDARDMNVFNCTLVYIFL